MLAKLGDFAFTVKDADLASVSRRLSFPWASKATLADHPTAYPTQKWSEEVELNGTLVARPERTLDDLIELAKRKEEVVFVPGISGEVFTVAILEIERTGGPFLDGGLPVQQSFRVKLQRVFT